MENVNTNIPSLRELMAITSELTIDSDTAARIEITLLPEELLGSSDEYEIIRNFYDKHPFMRQIGSEYFDIDGLTESRKKTLSEYLIWLVSTIRFWRKEESKFLHSELCQLASVFNWSGEFWQLFNWDSLGESDWVKHSKERILGVRGEITPTILCQNPITFSNENDKFVLSDKGRDWSNITHFLQTAERVFVPPEVRESIRLFFKHNFDELVEISNNVENSLTALIYSHSLTYSESLKLSFESSSPYIRFLLAYINIPRNIEVTDEKLLVALWSSVSLDREEFPKWLEVFNKHPVRFPQLQKVFGQVLATCSQEPIKEYFQSISLRTSPSEERKLVSECLAYFKQLASSEVRKCAWSTAYEVWKKWDFESNHDRCLVDVSQSVLDFAIVGYFVEVDPSEVNNAKHNLLQSFDKVLDDWHESKTEQLTMLNKAYSDFQPRHHAKLVLEGESDWYYDERHYKLEFTKGWGKYFQHMGLN